MTCFFHVADACVSGSSALAVGQRIAQIETLKTPSKREDRKCNRSGSVGCGMMKLWGRVGKWIAESILAGICWSEATSIVKDRRLLDAIRDFCPSVLTLELVFMHRRRAIRGIAVHEISNARLSLSSTPVDALNPPRVPSSPSCHR